MKFVLQKVLSSIICNACEPQECPLFGFYWQSIKAPHSFTESRTKVKENPAYTMTSFVLYKQDFLFIHIKFHMLHATIKYYYIIIIFYSIATQLNIVIKHSHSKKIN